MPLEFWPAMMRVCEWQTNCNHQLPHSPLTDESAKSTLGPKHESSTLDMAKHARLLDTMACWGISRVHRIMVGGPVDIGEGIKGHHHWQSF